MSEGFGKGAAVRWHWGSGVAKGTIEERFDRSVSRTIKGKRIRRNGTKDNPAYTVKQEDGGIVLKLGSELEKA